MRKVIAKLLTIAYKSKILKFKFDEDPLHRQFIFLPLWITGNDIFSTK